MADKLCRSAQSFKASQLATYLVLRFLYKSTKEVYMYYGFMGVDNNNPLVIVQLSRKSHDLGGSLYRGVSLPSHSVNGQTIRISAVNGQSGFGQCSNPSAERTRLVLQFAPNLAVGLHMRGMLIS